MKNIILITFIVISFIGFAQRDIMTVTRYLPKMENQVTKEDSLKDESMLEYIEREYQGVEEDTAVINQDFREREALKKGKITDPEREVVTFDYEKIFFTDMKDFERVEKERKEKEEIKEKEAIKPKK
jgi:hypothetical protein